LIKWKKPKKWAVFVSGRGSNLQAFLDIISDIDLSLVVSSSEKSISCDRAKRSSVPVIIFKPPTTWSELNSILLRHGITDIFLLGFMKIVPSSFLTIWSGGIYNLHPSLLPAYAGKNAWQRARVDNAALGVSIHKVTEGVDEGEVLLQKGICKDGESQSKNEQQTQLDVSWAEQILVRKMVQSWRF
jgi:phosphoribosylglycinamide formyltransferase 1